MDTILLADADRLERALDAFPDSFMNLSAAERRISLALYRLLARGLPAAPADISARAGTSRPLVEYLLETWPGVYRDDAGRVVGYWGLALSEMTHRLDLGGSTVYAWCVWDALFLPELLGAEARVTSRGPEGGTPVRLRVGPDGVQGGDGIYVSFLEPEEDELTADVIGSFCHFVHFFSTIKEGRRWVAAHPGTYLMTVEQAYELGRRKNERQYGRTLREPAAAPRAILFEGDLQFKPEMARINAAEDPLRKYLGSGDGTIRGAGLDGRVYFDLFERQGAAVCDARLAGRIEVDGGALVPFEAVGLFRRLDDAGHVWHLDAELQLETDAPAYARLAGARGRWEGVSYLRSHRHSYQVFAAVA